MKYRFTYIYDMKDGATCIIEIADLHDAIDEFWKQNGNAIITKIELIDFKRLGV